MESKSLDTISGDTGFGSDETISKVAEEVGERNGDEVVGKAEGEKKNDGNTAAAEVSANGDSSTQSGEHWIIRARGLPWSAREKDVRNFFKDLVIKQLHFVYTFEGRPSGEVYLELTSEQDVNHALALDREMIMNRYIEVHEATMTELKWVLSHQIQDSSHGSIVRIRGIPFNCSKEDIANFFEGLDMVEDGILMPVELGKPSGEAFVRFVDKENAEKALDKNMQNIGQRYIEVFKATSEEWEKAAAVPKMLGQWDGKRPRSLLEVDVPPPAPLIPRRGGPWYGRGRGMWGRGPPGMWGRFRAPPPWLQPGWQDEEEYFDEEWDESGFPRAKRAKWEGDPPNPCYVYMRGLPFEATASDVIAFFAPLKVLNVEIEFGKNKRALGGCRVEFSDTEEAMKAMAKDKQMMQHRYIDLFHAEAPPADKKSKKQKREGAFGSGEEGISTLFQFESKGTKGGGQQKRSSNFVGGSKGFVQGPSLQADMETQNPWMRPGVYGYGSGEQGTTSSTSTTMPQSSQYIGFTQGSSINYTAGSWQNQQQQQQQSYPVDAYQQQIQDAWANTQQQQQTQTQYQDAWAQYWQAWSQWQQQAMSWQQYQSSAPAGATTYTPSYAQPTGQAGTYSAAGKGIIHKLRDISSQDGPKADTETQKNAGAAPPWAFN